MKEMKACTVKCSTESGEVAAARRLGSAGGAGKASLADERTKARSAIVLKVFPSDVGPRLPVRVGAIAGLPAASLRRYEPQSRMKSEVVKSFSGWLAIKSSNQSLQHNDHVRHGSCLRTLRASHDRG